MFRRGAIRWVVALALAAGLASPALAAPRAPKVEAGLHLGSLWEAVAGWLASSWTSLSGATSNADGDHGWSMDPDGTTSNADGDRGFSMDPNG